MARDGLTMRAAARGAHGGSRLAVRGGHGGWRLAVRGARCGVMRCGAMRCGVVRCGGRWQRCGAVWWQLMAGAVW